jgi:hypothetical protein
VNSTTAERRKAMKREHHRKTVNGVAPGDPALAIQKRIALRAYELYLQRGGVDGHAEEDWLQAEREILPNQDR